VNLQALLKLIAYSVQYHPQIDRFDIKFITYFFGTEVLDQLFSEDRPSNDLFDSKAASRVT